MRFSSATIRPHDALVTAALMVLASLTQALLQSVNALAASLRSMALPQEVMKQEATVVHIWMEG